MNNSTDIKTQYFLRPVHGSGYEIVEHNTEEPKGRGGVCFSVNEYGITDGDGFPACNNEQYLQITEDDYKHVMNLFRKAGKTMCDLGDKAAKPLDRPIAEGDYLYDGMDYVHIDSITSGGKYRGENFYYDPYIACIYMDTDDLEDVFDTEEGDDEFLLIPEDTFTDALNILRSAILEITDYLDRLYKN